MKKKTLTIEEIFCGMPRLRDYFQEQERLIEKFGEGNENNPAVQELKQKTKVLLDTVKNMGIRDLKVIYYLNNTPRFSIFEVLTPLRKMHTARCELKNAVNDTNEYKNLIEDETDE